MTTWVSKRTAKQKATPPKKEPSGPRDIQDTPDLEKYLLVSSSKSSSTSTGPSKSLYCGICADVFKRPYRAPCGHSFCQRCITTWLSMNKTCPQDRRPLTVAQLHHDFILESLILEQPAVCPYKAQGCPIGIRPLAEIRQHVPQCNYNPDNLPDFIRAVLPTGDENDEEEEEDVASPVVISDDSGDENLRRRPAQRRNNHQTATNSTPVATSSRRVVSIQSSPEEEATSSSNAAALPLRLRLLRTGVASVDQLRDVVGGPSSHP